MKYLIYGLGAAFTLVSALFNYQLGSWVGTTSLFGLSILGCAYASLDFALAYLVYMVRRVPIIAGVFVGLWCVYLAALSCWSIMSYSAASDAALKPEYKRIGELTQEIKSDEHLKRIWSDKLGQTHRHTSSWESKQRTVVNRIEANKSELTRLRNSNPPLPLIAFHQYGLEGSVTWVRSAFGIGFTITGLMLFLTVPPCSKPTPRKRSEQPKNKPRARKKPVSRGTSNADSNVIQLIRNKEIEPNVRSVRAKVGSTDKASKLMKEVGPKLVKEGILVESGRGYKYA